MNNFRFHLLSFGVLDPSSRRFSTELLTAVDVSDWGMSNSDEGLSRSDVGFDGESSEFEGLGLSGVLSVSLFCDGLR